MTDKEIFDELKEVYKKVTEQEADFTLTSTLTGELEMDSIMMLCMAIEIENAFGVAVDNSILNSVQTVGDMVKYIKGKKSE